MKTKEYENLVKQFNMMSKFYKETEIETSIPEIRLSMGQFARNSEGMQLLAQGLLDLKRIVDPMDIK